MVMKSISSLNIRYKSAPIPSIVIDEFDELDDHVGVLSNEEAKRISAYMEIFRRKDGDWMSYPFDPLNEKIEVTWDNGEDGKYCWSGLTHYLIDNYRVDPPMKFRQHVEERLNSGVDLASHAKKILTPESCSIRYHERIAILRDVEVTWLLYP